MNKRQLNVCESGECSCAVYVVCICLCEFTSLMYWNHIEMSKSTVVEEWTVVVLLTVPFRKWMNEWIGCRSQGVVIRSEPHVLELFNKSHMFQMLHVLANHANHRSTCSAPITNQPWPCIKWIKTPMVFWFFSHIPILQIIY